MKNLSVTVHGNVFSTILNGEFVLVVVEESKLYLQQTIQIIDAELEKFYLFKKHQPDYRLCLGESVNSMENITTSYQLAVNVKTISKKICF